MKRILGITALCMGLGSGAWAQPVVQFMADSSSGLESITSVPILVSAVPPAASPITVSYTVVGGSATVVDDYGAPSGTLVIPAGASTNAILLTVINDSLPESSETVVFRIDQASGATVGERRFHTYTILDNDKPPSIVPIEVSFQSPSGSGPESKTPAELVVALSDAVSVEVTVEYALGEGNATVDEDFTFAPGTLTFPAGSTLQSIEIPIIDDDKPEKDEKFSVYLHTASGADLVAPTSMTYRIIDNDFPVIAFEEESSSALESDAVIPVVVQLDRASDLETRVSFNLAGTARRDVNYVLSPGTLVFAPGATEETISLEIISNDLVEGDKVVEIHLASPVRGQLGEPRLYSHTIEDKDAPQPTVTLSYTAPEEDPLISDSSITSRGLESVSPVDLHVMLSAPAAGPVQVGYRLGGEATEPGDYELDADNPLVIPTGQTSVVMRFDIVDDAQPEPLKDLVVTFTNATGAAMSPGLSFTYWIIDDDVPPEEISLFKSVVPSRVDGQFLHVIGSQTPSVVPRGLAVDSGGNYYLSDQGAGGPAGGGSILMWPRGQERLLRIMTDLTQPEDVELSADGRALVVAGPLGAVDVIPFGVSVRVLNTDISDDAVVYVRSDTGTHTARRAPDGWFHVPNILVTGQERSFIDLLVEVNGKTRTFVGLPLGAPGTGANPEGQTIIEVSF